MIDKRDWNEFRDSGLLFYINQVLHVFGWAIIMQIDDETGNIVGCFPARVKFRGFSNEDTTDGYTKVTEYLHKESDKLLSEVHNTEI